ncbi:MAG: hypothetical protein PSV13_10785 [Lacunisphaera sp.]|nr:hypothetical protein [Lacunisphaera sp.]
MINSTPRSDPIARPDLVAPAATRAPVLGLGTDRFSAGNSAALRAALVAQPEIRPEVVARGRALAVDPSYPSVEVLRQVGAALLSSPDLTDDVS